MTRTSFLLTMIGTLVALCLPLPAEAWVAYRGFHSYGAYYGHPAAWGYGAGAYHGAYYARPPAWGESSGSVTGRYGSSASWDDGSGSATGRYGGSASWSR